MIDYKEFLEKVEEKLSWVADELDFIHPYTTRQGKYEAERIIPMPGHRASGEVFFGICTSRPVTKSS